MQSISFIFVNVSSENWYVFSVIWNASSVNTIPVPVKGELECVWCSTGMLQNFKGSLKIKGRVKFFKISGVTCPSQGLLIYITSKHL
jgi:hypothetical protein